MKKRMIGTAWRGGPRFQSRAADSVALGSLGGTTLDTPTLIVPLPGAPEPIGVTRPAMGGCGCNSCGGHSHGVGDVVDSVPGGYLTIGVAAFLLWRALRKQ